MSEEPRAKRPTGLGRGLSSLLGEVSRETPVGGTGGSSDIRLIPVASIEPHPGQPRRIFQEEALAELAASIQARGVIQPIVVRPHGHRFQIVAGERRWRASQKARLHEIPAIVRDFTDAETLEVALIENIQRQDLNAIEEAQAYKRLVEDYGHTQEALGRVVNKSRSHVANLLRLLDLPAQVQVMVGAGQLTMGHARALVTAADPEELADEVVRRGLSVRETEKLVQSGRPTRQRPLPIGYKDANADIAALERQLADMTGLKVSIKHAPKGGAVTLNYSSLDQLDMICQRLSGGKF
ncbi:ParB/RepB/Spo0J family partition protein [Sphingosinicella ginsenosidimutans]|jgi:ParB family chromosome partitioning protein|uniref:ParB/RepB/Spo0J family partition protein n=1 Tax=Allosphingosinicella ginsenosidimutans TaxID=1176539 RepID=A0A5C6TSA7_9SPHN|nr:ParB/RepB/Spo0J family partition protein [Sphingosinicella ginsenosidimutans]TXC63274.1 ParB/RepB/Spo0J family partition protein [Sphingosinicella ginsenosidimutans]